MLRLSTPTLSRIIGDRRAFLENGPGPGNSTVKPLEIIRSVKFPENRIQSNSMTNVDILNDVGEFPVCICICVRIYRVCTDE